MEDLDLLLLQAGDVQGRGVLDPQKVVGGYMEKPGELDQQRRGWRRDPRFPCIDRAPGHAESLCQR